MPDSHYNLYQLQSLAMETTWLTLPKPNKTPRIYLDCRNPLTLIGVWRKSVHLLHFYNMSECLGFNHWNLSQYMPNPREYFIIHQSPKFRPRSSKISFTSLPTPSPLFLSRASRIFSLISASGPEGLHAAEQLSLNHPGYQEPLQVSSAISCLRQVQLVQVPQGHVQ